MTPQDVTALGDFLDFLQSIGVGFGDVVVIMVLCGFFWLIKQGKLKIGNGDHKYVEQDEYREDVKEIKGAVKGIRDKVQEMDNSLTEVKTKVNLFEQFRDK